MLSAWTENLKNQFVQVSRRRMTFFFFFFFSMSLKGLRKQKQNRLMLVVGPRESQNLGNPDYGNSVQKIFYERLHQRV